MTERFVWDYQNPQQRVAGRDESMKIAKEIHDEITIKNRDLIYTHEVIIFNCKMYLALLIYVVHISLLNH